ncbi:MAG: PAS domain-containing protein [Steroidobacteraceae bacterium]
MADTALDSLRDAVVVFDARQKHLPVVLANAAARRYLREPADAIELVEIQLHRWMTAASVATIESIVANLAETPSPVSCVLSWRSAQGEASALTDIRPLPTAPGQRPVMLTFAPSGPVFDLIEAVENLPPEVLILDADLKVTYANASALRSSAAATDGAVLGTSALWLTPTSSLQLDAYARALQGCPFHDEAVEVVSPEGPSRWFEVDLQPLKGIRGVIGLVVLSLEVTDRRRRREQEILDVAGRERRDIGRDLHDGLGQELTGVALMLRGLAGRVQERCPDAVESIHEIADVVSRSIDNARSLARGLLPVRDTGGLAPALQELAARSRTLYGLEVDVVWEVAPDVHFSEAEANHIYRIAQEALTNAARHGHGSRIEIAVSASRQAFLLVVSDDGEGITPPATPYSGMGMNIMKYRAGIIGAKFEIVPRKPRGTVVRVIGEQTLKAALTRPTHLRSEC